MACPNIEDLYEQVYDNFEENVWNVEYFKKRCILSSRNDTVNIINEELLERVPGEEHVFQGIDTVIGEEHQAQVQPEWLNGVEVSGLPQYRLKLKIGAVFMLLRNLDVPNGHCNGTRYKITNMTRRLIVAMPLDSIHGENEIYIPRVPICTKEGEFPWIIKRLQFPVRLAFTITFNRAQGQTLEKVGLMIPV
jgi:ATP-dependent DNA helicase PIF1